ncbi:hypothetical protein GCM10011607_12040 [Shewanella inventionis]|uniref:Uncharacterized protein n=1 Tax=Shewanella inventionis TaxID=1738770 RepID=A0ABQ1IXZ6_9GAMM|nr:hypothetical protein [Shewanella inventionis]GGB53124.1 hypothetical protein GCM10011607_12040 [Shewanella inventionis]
MNENKFKTYLTAAKSLNNEYSRGYQRGLRRHFHGEGFGSDEEHEQYMKLGLHGDYRVDIGNGYRDGFTGKPPLGFHANLGNSNAQHELPADSQLQCRLNSQLKSRFVKQAQKEGMKLTPWILKTLQNACHDEEI